MRAVVTAPVSREVELTMTLKEVVVAVDLVTGGMLTMTKIGHENPNQQILVPTNQTGTNQERAPASMWTHHIQQFLSMVMEILIYRIPTTIEIKSLQRTMQLELQWPLRSVLL